MRTRYPEVIEAAVPKGYKPLSAFSRVPRPIRTGKELLSAFLWLAAVVAIGFALALAWRKSPGWIGGALGTCAAVLIARETHRLCRKIDRRHWQRLAEDDLRELGERRPGERYVGIAYCYGLWTIEGEGSWDRGYLSAGDGWLEFRGFGPGFRVPLARTENVRIATTYNLFKTNRPRVYLDWIHPESGRNTISIGPVGNAPRETLRAGAEDLREWLLAERARDVAVDEGSAEWPFQSAELDFASNPDLQTVTKTDRLVGLGVGVGMAIVCLVILETVATLVHFTHAGVFGGLFSSVAGAMSQNVVLNRVRKRRNEVQSISPIARKTLKGS